MRHLIVLETNSASEFAKYGLIYCKNKQDVPPLFELFPFSAGKRRWINITVIYYYCKKE